MSFSPVPDLCVPDIFFLTPKFLSSRGITLLLMDLDNTLATYRATEPSGEVLTWLQSLKSAGISPFIVSNSKRSERADGFARAARVPIIKAAGKPDPRGVLLAMNRMERRPEETALVGDQIVTDCLAANRAEILSIVVRPMDLSNPFFALRYLVEQPFRSLCKERLG